jgi:hypothetical protein
MKQCEPDYGAEASLQRCTFAPSAASIRTNHPPGRWSSLAQPRSRAMILDPYKFFLRSNSSLRCRVSCAIVMPCLRPLRRSAPIHGICAVFNAAPSALTLPTSAMLWQWRISSTRQTPIHSRTMANNRARKAEAIGYMATNQAVVGSNPAGRAI